MVRVGGRGKWEKGTGEQGTAHHEFSRCAVLIFPDPHRFPPPPLPSPRSEQTIARVSEPARESAGPIADPELRKALSARPLAAVLDLPALANSIRRMPSSAWGVGGFAIKAGTVRWLDALDDLRAITGGAYLDDDAVGVELDLRFVKR